VFVVTSLVVGLLCGVFNGLLIAGAGYTPILATLGTQLIFIGFAVALTDGAAILFPYSETFSFVGNDSVFGVPVPFAIFIAAAFIVYVLIELAPFGQRFAMMGTNLTAARYAGLNTKRLVVSTYALCGLFSAFTGIVMASRTASVKWDYGNSYLLIAILTVVMAGVHPAGGVGRVINVVLATVALQLLSSTFSILGMSSFIKDFAWGLLLIVSISVPYLLNRTGALRSVFGTRGRPSQPQQRGGAA
jgi:simple sugar transport system permease protein